MEEDDSQESTGENEINDNQSNIKSSTEKNDEPVFDPEQDSRINRHLWILYSSSFLSAWGDRLWQFAVPLILASTFTNSLLPAATFSFTNLLFCFLFGTVVGKTIDNSSRKYIIVYSLIIQNSCVIICSLCLYFILPYTSEYAPFYIEGTSELNWHFLILFVSLNLFGGISSLASMVESIAVGRDWIIVISEKSTTHLAGANAMITRISLLCKFAAPVVFGVVLQYASLKGTIYFITIWNVISIFPECYALLHLYDRCVGLQTKLVSPDRDASIIPFMAFFQGWKEYFGNGKILLASLSYVFLYLTALSPGSLMSAFLLIHGVDAIYISIWSAVAAIIGVLATLVTPKLIIRHGLEVTGLYSIWFQQICLIFTVVCFYVVLPIQEQFGIFGFLFFLMISRLGLWAFDLAERQIMQDLVEEENRGVINGVEYSLTNLFGLLSYALGMVAPDPNQFGILVLISFVMVTLAAATFSVWALNRKVNIFPWNNNPQEPTDTDIEMNPRKKQ